MENAVIRACQIQARRVMQAMLMFNTYKEVKPRKALSELDLVPEITEEFIKQVYAVVWIGAKWNEFLWKDFLKNHFSRMSKTLYLFANYVSYACYVLIEKHTDAYACFVDVVSLVIHFCNYCSKQGQKKFNHTWLELVCAIFDEKLCIIFVEQGHWNGFHKYLENVENFKLICELVKESKNELDLLPNFESILKKSPKSCVINGDLLKDITQLQVENHKMAVNFANSVKDKVKNVCRISLEDLLKGFQETETQAEDLFCEIARGASGGIVGCRDPLQEIQEKSSENFCTSMTSEKTENTSKEGKDSDTFQNKNIESIKDQDLIPGLDRIPKLENIKKAKSLLREMMEDIANISELVKFVCEENETDIPYKL